MSNSLMNKFEKSISRCQICFSAYDRSQKTPVIICTRHHTICRQCMDILNRRAACPFCREPIQFSKVVINYYVFDLLPQKRGSVNSRAEVEDQYLARTMNVSEEAQGRIKQRNEEQYFRVKIAQNNIVDIKDRPNSSLTQQYRHTTLNNSINSRPLFYVYPESDDSQQEESEEVRHKKIWHWLGTFFITYLQIPFALINIYLSVSYPVSECMDSSHDMPFIILRPWFFGMGIIELVLAACMIISNFLNQQKIISTQKNLEFGIYLIELTEFKTILWGIVEIGLFVEDIMNHCSNFVFIYGAVMILCHVSLFLVYLMCGKQKVISYFDD